MKNNVKFFKSKGKYFAMRYCSEEEKKENLTDILECFSKKHSYWGIDKCKLRLISSVKLNQEHLEKLVKNNPKMFTTNYDNHNKLKEIIIKDDQIGKVKLYFKTKEDEETYQIFELIKGGINVLTVGAHGIKERLQFAIELLRYKYQIILTDSYAILQEIELACTMAFDKMPHLQTKKILVEAFGNGEAANLNTSKTFKKIYSKLSIKKSPNTSIVMYDKIIKAIDNRQINPNDDRLCDFNVLRLEIKISKKDLEKKLIFLNINNLYDERIIQFLEGEISLAYIQFIQHIEESIIQINNYLETIHNGLKNITYKDYTNRLIQIANDCSQSLLKTPILDEELIIFLPLRFLNKHRSKIKKDIVQYLQDDESKTATPHFFGEMISWQTILLFRILFESIEFAKTSGLGCKKTTNAREVHKIHIKEYPIELRNNIFKEFILSTNRKTIDDPDRILGLFLNRLLFDKNELL